MKHWILATRPKTLVATLVPVLCGTWLAHLYVFELRWDLLGWALLSTLCLQIATNYINDAMDFKRGTDTEHRLGPTRVSSSGLLPVAAVHRAGVGFLALAVLFGIPLMEAGGWPIVVIGIASVIASYCYTGGPYPLAYHGLGDIFVLVFFGWTAVGGSYFLQTGRYGLEPFLLGTQLGLLATALIAINNLRDIVEDRRNRKHTFAALTGVRAARIEITLALLLPFALSSYWVVQHSHRFFYTWIGLPLAAAVVQKVWNTEPSRKYNEFLAFTALVNLLFALGFGAAVWFIT